MTGTVTITKQWHDESETIGYAEGKLSGREFTASWINSKTIGALFYDSRLDATDSQLRQISKALNSMKARPPVALIEKEQRQKSKSSNQAL